MVQKRQWSWRNRLMGMAWFAAWFINAGQFAAVATNQTATNQTMGAPEPTQLPASGKANIPKSAQKVPMQMTWGGGHVTGDDWSIYTGTSASLSGSINENGWRMRLIGGYGSYTYEGTKHIDGRSVQTAFDGQSSFGDVLVGYRLQTGDLIVKAFAGISSVGHSVQPFDPDNTAIGYRYGGSAAFEIWFNTSDSLWLSSETTYSTVFDTYNATLRAGYRAWPQLSLGLETGLAGNNDYTAVRAAGVAAAEFGLLEAQDGYVRISAGASADRDMELSPYAAVSFALKY